MRKDLVASLGNSGTDSVHYTVLLIKDNGNYALTSNGTKSYLSYNKLAIGPSNSQYQLSISGFTADPFSSYSINMKFTTKDRDNDQNHSGNCAVKSHGGNAGGWWYSNCAHILPNHQYKHADSLYFNNKWLHSPSFIEMKIKPINC